MAPPKPIWPPKDPSFNITHMAVHGKKGAISAIWRPPKRLAGSAPASQSQNSAVYLARVITQAFFIFWGGGNESRTRQSNIFEAFAETYQT